MEDFKSWKLNELIDLWVDMASPDTDILPVSDKYHKKKIQISYLIMEKINLSYKDTMVILNTKRVEREEKELMFIEKIEIIHLIKTKKDKQNWQYGECRKTIRFVKQSFKTYYIKHSYNIGGVVDSN